MATYVPPRDAFELQIAVTAADVLSRESVGVFDDLTELIEDGDCVAEIVARLAGLLGRKLEGKELRRCRTVAALASSYRGLPRRGGWSSLVMMRCRTVGGCVLRFRSPAGRQRLLVFEPCTPAA